MEFQTVLVTKEEGGLGFIKINRPDSLNALNAQVGKDIRKAAELLNDDSEVKVVIVTGEGKAFAAGADIKELKDATPYGAREWARALFDSFNFMGTIPKPVIAAVNGLAFGGGCELALSCDFILASEKAKFGVPEIKIGVIPGAGGMYRLAKVVGMRMAKELVFVGDPIDAKTAQTLGLVNKVFPAETFMDEVRSLARTIASRSGVVIKVAKQALNDAESAPDPIGVYRDIEALGLVFSTEDQTEGMTAFVEKREPQFKNK
ncbi:MAG: enoyl-CoA hydratase-related protein [Spirochaetota bacterium]|nr:enoyl-CoA hydratase-related protein [Spirochaetota bacterium]